MAARREEAEAERAPLCAKEGNELREVVVASATSGSVEKESTSTLVFSSPLDLDLLKAVQGGDCDQVNRCLRAGASASAVDSPSELSCAQIATKSGRGDILKSLLANTADVHVTDAHRKTLLHLAVEGQHLECLELLKTAVVVDGEDSKNETALFAAVRRGWLSGVKSLLDAGADITKKYGHKNNRKTVLQLAACLGEETEVLAEVVEAANRRNSNQIIDSGSTPPLLTAASRGKLKFVKTLITAGADVTRLDKEGRNVLHCAVENAQLPVIHELFKFKPKEMAELVSQKCSKGNVRGIPLHLAVYLGDLRCVKFLIKKNIDSVSEVADTDHHKNCNVLHLTSESNRAEVTEYFAAVLCRQQTTKKSTNLDDTLREVFQQLVRKPTKTGYTPLHFALLRRKLEFVKALIDVGSDLTAKCIDKSGQTRTAMDILIYQLPSSVELLTDFLDQSIKRSARTTSVLVDFKILLSHVNVEERRKCRHGCKTHKANNFGVLDALRKTGDNLGQRKLFEHPLIESFLSLHWKRLRGPYMTLVVVNVLFSLLLSLLVLFNRSSPSPETRLSLVPLVSVFLALLLVHEAECLAKIKKQPGAYWAELAMKLTCFALAAWTCLHDPPRVCPALAVLLAWFEVILLVSRLPHRGYYMLMFVEVTVKYLKVLGLFAFLVFGFLVAFMAVFKHNAPFDSFLPAVMKIIVMITNELDYEDLKTNFQKLNLSELSQVLAMGMFILFIVFIGLVMINFLVVVAIIKIEKLHFLSHQVVFLCVYEEFLLSKWWSCVCCRYCYGSVILSLFDVVCAIARPLAPGWVGRWKSFAQIKSSYNIDILADTDSLKFSQELYSSIIVKGYENRERLEKIYKGKKDAKGTSSSFAQPWCP